MKTQLLWACVCVCGATLAAALPPPLPLESSADAPVALPPPGPGLDVAAQARARAEAEEAARVKRSHGLLGIVANKVTSKIASASSGLSSSSYDQHHEIEYPPVPSYGHKSFDLWGFKKALFSTLLQAVKAIKGGIIALKGQLIKAKGHILTTKGNLFKAKGEALTDLGRHIATKALMPASSHTSSGHSGPSGHAHIEYSAPGSSAIAVDTGPDLPPHPPPHEHATQHSFPSFDLQSIFSALNIFGSDDDGHGDDYGPDHGEGYEVEPPSGHGVGPDGDHGEHHGPHGGPHYGSDESGGYGSGPSYGSSYGNKPVTGQGQAHISQHDDQSSHHFSSPSLGHDFNQNVGYGHTPSFTHGPGQTLGYDHTPSLAHDSGQNLGYGHSPNLAHDSGQNENYGHDSHSNYDHGAELTPNHGVNIEQDHGLNVGHESSNTELTTTYSIGYENIGNQQEVENTLKEIWKHNMNQVLSHNVQHGLKANLPNTLGDSATHFVGHGFIQGIEGHDNSHDSHKDPSYGVESQESNEISDYFSGHKLAQASGISYKKVPGHGYDHILDNILQGSDTVADHDKTFITNDAPKKVSDYFSGQKWNQLSEHNPSFLSPLNFERNLSNTVHEPEDASPNPLGLVQLPPSAPNTEEGLTKSHASAPDPILGGGLRAPLSLGLGLPDVPLHLKDAAEGREDAPLGPEAYVAGETATPRTTTEEAPTLAPANALAHAPAHERGFERGVGYVAHASQMEPAASLSSGSGAAFSSAPAYLPPHGMPSSYYGPPPISSPSLSYGAPTLPHHFHQRSSSGSSSGSSSSSSSSSSLSSGKLPDGVHAGLLILKPFPLGTGSSSKGLLGQHSAPLTAVVPAPSHAVASAGSARSHQPLYAAAPSDSQVTVHKALDFGELPDFGGFFHGF